MELLGPKPAQCYNALGLLATKNNVHRITTSKKTTKYAQYTRDIVIVQYWGLSCSSLCPMALGWERNRTSGNQSQVIAKNVIYGAGIESRSLLHVEKGATG